MKDEVFFFEVRVAGKGRVEMLAGREGEYESLKFTFRLLDHLKTSIIFRSMFKRRCHLQISNR